MLKQLNLVENTDRDVVAIEMVFPNGHIVPPHTHQRIQLLYAAAGIIQLETQFDTWIVPSGFAVWIPASVSHQLGTINVTTHSLYFRQLVLRTPPEQCQVIAVPPFLRELINEVMKVPLLYEPDSRDGLLMKMLQQEASIQPVVPLHLPMPRDAALARLCQAFFKFPTQACTPGSWARQLHISERTFYRRFLANTGMTFMAWRQQACIIAALSRLSLNESVTNIALDMGYESPASFSTMFKKSMGAPPSVYMRQQLAAP